MELLPSCRATNLDARGASRKGSGAGPVGGGAERGSRVGAPSSCPRDDPGRAGPGIPSAMASHEPADEPGRLGPALRSRLGADLPRPVRAPCLRGSSSGTRLRKLWARETAACSPRGRVSHLAVGSVGADALPALDRRRRAGGSGPASKHPAGAAAPMRRAPLRKRRPLGLCNVRTARVCRGCRPAGRHLHAYRPHRHLSGPGVTPVDGLWENQWR